MVGSWFHFAKSLYVGGREESCKVWRLMYCTQGPPFNKWKSKSLKPFRPFLDCVWICQQCRYNLFTLFKSLWKLLNSLMYKWLNRQRSRALSKIKSHCFRLHASQLVLSRNTASLNKTQSCCNFIQYLKRRCRLYHAIQKCFSPTFFHNQVIIWPDNMHARFNYAFTFSFPLTIILSFVSWLCYNILFSSARISWCLIYLLWKNNI